MFGIKLIKKMRKREEKIMCVYCRQYMDAESADYKVFTHNPALNVTVSCCNSCYPKHKGSIQADINEYLFGFRDYL